MGNNIVNRGRGSRTGIAISDIVIDDVTRRCFTMLQQDGTKLSPLNPTGIGSGLLIEPGTDQLGLLPVRLYTDSRAWYVAQQDHPRASGGRANPQLWGNVRLPWSLFNATAMKRVMDDLLDSEQQFYEGQYSGKGGYVFGKAPSGNAPRQQPLLSLGGNGQFAGVNKDDTGHARGEKWADRSGSPILSLTMWSRLFDFVTHTQQRRSSFGGSAQKSLNHHMSLLPIFEAREAYKSQLKPAQVNSLAQQLLQPRR